MRPNKTALLQRLAPLNSRIRWIRDHFELHQPQQEPIILGHAFTTALVKLKTIAKPHR